MDLKTKSQINGNLNRGNAGEHYVCFDCWGQGYPTFLVPQQADHDLMMEGLRKDWLAIQVKSVSTHVKNKPNIYQWSILTGGHVRKRFTQETVIDIFAFVILEEPIALYYAANQIKTKNKVTIHHRDFDKYTLENALLDVYQDYD